MTGSMGSRDRACRRRQAREGCRRSSDRSTKEHRGRASSQRQGTREGGVEGEEGRTARSSKTWWKPSRTRKKRLHRSAQKATSTGSKCWVSNSPGQSTFLHAPVLVIGPVLASFFARLRSFVRRRRRAPTSSLLKMPWATRTICRSSPVRAASTTWGRMNLSIALGMTEHRASTGCG